MVRKNKGGVVVGRKKIFCLKFAKDVVMVPDSVVRLRNTIKDLEKFSEKSSMQLNEERTKVMIFRKDGMEKKDKWEFKGRELRMGHRLGKQLLRSRK